MPDVATALISLGAVGVGSVLTWIGRDIADRHADKRQERRDLQAHERQLARDRPEYAVRFNADKRSRLLREYIALRFVSMNVLRFSKQLRGLFDKDTVDEASKRWFEHMTEKLEDAKDELDRAVALIELESGIEVAHVYYDLVDTFTEYAELVQQAAEPRGWLGRVVGTPRADRSKLPEIDTVLISMRGLVDSLLGTMRGELKKLSVDVEPGDSLVQEEGAGPVTQ